MFERFTDRARKVMALANKEAHRFNHEHIDTEHILLGFVIEASGLGSAILRALNADCRKVRREIEKHLAPGTGKAGPAKLPQTPAAKQVIQTAIDESRALGDSYVGTEHILLGLLQQSQGVAADVLASFGLTAESARAEFVRQKFAHGEDPAPLQPGPTPTLSEAILHITHRLRVLIHFAAEEAERRKHPQVVAEHLLTAMLRQKSGAAIQVLHDLEVNVTDLRKAIRTSIPLGPEQLSQRPVLSAGLLRLFGLASDEARNLGDARAGTGHFLLAVLHDSALPVTRLLAGLGVYYDSVRHGLGRLDANTDRGDAIDPPNDDSESTETPKIPKSVSRAYGHDRFTDRARKVVALATQDAQRLKHAYIGTEHLLLGLIREGSGVGANVLKNLDVSLQMVRREVKRLVKSGPRPVNASDIVPTPRSIAVLEFAQDEARRLCHNYLGTEHLLLGLLREQDGVAAQVLVNLGVNLSDVREEIMNLLGVGYEFEYDDPAESPDSSPRPESTESATVRWVLAHDSIHDDLSAQRDVKVDNGEYEAAAQLRDTLIQRASLLTRVIHELLIQNAVLAYQIRYAVNSAAQGQTADMASTLLALIRSDPNLAARLAPLLPEIEKACRDEPTGPPNADDPRPRQ